jgi:hypothetical protein
MEIVGDLARIRVRVATRKTTAQSAQRKIATERFRESERFATRTHAEKVQPVHVAQTASVQYSARVIARMGVEII